MANVTETAAWESGVYQIETGDYLLGGANGTLNVQPKQLANRTQYLKARADQVDSAASGFGSLDARLGSMQASISSLDEDTQNSIMAALKFALDQSGVANYGVRSLKELAQQEGEIVIKNRGVVSGCAVSKSGTAARNLNIAAGYGFCNGRAYYVSDGENAASVPSNITGGTVTVYAYLYVDAGGLYRLAVTPIGAAIPDEANVIYNITIPTNSTDATDPNLTSVTLTDVRRIETQFPQLLNSPVSTSPVLLMLADNDYNLDFDVVSSVGAPCDEDQIVISSRAPNGFTVLLASVADNVVVRWKASKLNN